MKDAEKINGDIVFNKQACERKIIDKFLVTYYKNKSHYSYEFDTMLDNQIGSAHQFKYIDKESSKILIVFVIRIIENDIKYEQTIKKLFKEIKRKLHRDDTTEHDNILFIFKKKGIETWWQIRQFIADYEVYEQDWLFSENRINGVYEIIFDDQGLQDITLNIGHPKSERGSKGLCPKTDLFSNDTTYRVFRENYFTQ